MQIKKKAPVVATPVHLDLPTWEDETISKVFNVTLKVRLLRAHWSWRVRRFVVERDRREVLVRGRVAEKSGRGTTG